MAKTLSQLTAQTVELPIAVGDDPAAFIVHYRPHNMTADVEKKANEAIKNSAELEAAVEMALPIIASWDLRMDEDSGVVPVTKEGLSTVPVSILMLVMQQVGEHRNPDPKGT